ncbi:MAG: FtsW/RodA/SpoVE family cell cycle protein, partial [Limnobacter sp.]|nr:FtsW/RodA/SpoVE family cell cycle protein [Limnobacter sp.]
MKATAKPIIKLPRLDRLIGVFDPVLSMILLSLVLLAVVTQYSAAFDYSGRFEDQLRNLFIAFAVMWFAACVPPQTLMKVALPTYLLGVFLLIGVALFGDISKGARRWLDLGFIRIQPSEIMKIAMPMMLAWFFQQRENVSGWREFLVATILLAIPGALILKQPDLGTALLVIGAGFFVIFFAGLSWKLLGYLATLFVCSLPLVWSLMHEYQRQRVLTLLDPTKDPLGKGFHI